MNDYFETLKNKVKETEEKESMLIEELIERFLFTSKLSTKDIILCRKMEADCVRFWVEAKTENDKRIDAEPRALDELLNWAEEEACRVSPLIHLDDLRAKIDEMKTQL